MLSMPVNPVAIHHDSWAVKIFFSHALRRAGVERMDSGDSPSRRAAQSTIVEFPIKRSRLIPFTRYVLNLGRSLFIGGLILICCSKAAGVTEVFDAMMNHWEKPLKELSAQRMRRRSEGHTEVIEIPDDDCKSVSMDDDDCKGKGKGRGKAAKAKAKPYAKRKAQKKVEEHEISDESDEEDEDEEEEISSKHAKKRAEVKLREAKNAKTKNSEPSSDSELPLPKDSKVEKVTKKKTTEEAPAKKKKTEEKMTEEAPAKKKKTEEKMTEEAPAKKKKKTEEQMTEEAPAKKKTEAEAVPDKKKKRTDEAPEKGEPKTLARRPCPKTSPASDRWIAISQTFKKHVAPRIVALGLYTYSYEDRGAKFPIAI